MTTDAEIWKECCELIREPEVQRAAYFRAKENATLAAELLDDALLALVRARHAGRKVTDPIGYAKRTVRNIAASYYRKKKRQKELHVPDAIPASDNALIDEELLLFKRRFHLLRQHFEFAMVHDQLGLLPPKLRRFAWALVQHRRKQSIKEELQFSEKKFHKYLELLGAYTNPYKEQDEAIKNMMLYYSSIFLPPGPDLPDDLTPLEKFVFMANAVNDNPELFVAAGLTYEMIRLFRKKAQRTLVTLGELVEAVCSDPRQMKLHTKLLAFVKRATRGKIEHFVVFEERVVMPRIRNNLPFPVVSPIPKAPTAKVEAGHADNGPSSS